MQRKDFIKLCGGSCLGLLGINLVQACTPTKHVQSTISNNRIQIGKSEFHLLSKEKISFRKNILTKPNGFDYPLVIYRFSDTEYSALLLRCTHQNNELSMNGDILSCSAHGSEFDNKGVVIQGPAEQRLQSFHVSSDEQNIYINLS